MQKKIFMIVIYTSTLTFQTENFSQDLDLELCCDLFLSMLLFHHPIQKLNQVKISLFLFGFLLPLGLTLITAFYVCTGKLHTVNILTQQKEMATQFFIKQKCIQKHRNTCKKSPIILNLT